MKDSRHEMSFVNGKIGRKLIHLGLPTDFILKADEISKQENNSDYIEEVATNLIKLDLAHQKLYKNNLWSKIQWWLRT